LKKTAALDLTGEQDGIEPPGRYARDDRGNRLGMRDRKAAQGEASLY
jgi:hypothetical protein